MFWTAFIWGLGVSCGACFGMLLFLILKALLDKLTNTKAYKAFEEYNEQMLNLLTDRNEINGKMATHLEKLVLIMQAPKENRKKHDGGESLKKKFCQY